MKRIRSFLSLLLSAILLVGCSDLLYFSKLGWHQGAIQYHSVPIEEVLGNGGMNAESKEKICFIQEVKRYGEERLGLKRTNNYTTFVDMKGPVLHVVTACEKDKLQLFSWTFPIIGQVTYKGFFAREDALKEKRSLDDKGYDTFLQGADAYSTLGWLKDPIFSFMLESDRASLANLILHEMTHGTIYLKGKTAFNEQVATFVGNRGAIDFLTEKYGAESREVKHARSIQEGDLIFGRWIDRACHRLADFYGQEIPRDQKMKEREGIFRSLREEFKEVKPHLKTEAYTRFERVDLNNAVLLAFHRYVHRLGNFEPLYEKLGRDLKRVVEFLKKIQPDEIRDEEFGMGN